MAIEFAAERYVDDVLSGRQVACRWVRLACERHRKDLETGHERGLYFDDTAAKVAIAFFAVVRHWKGEWAGKPISLEPAQQFWVWSLFGWKREDGSRRFRTGYLEVGRKNGKTTLAAGVGLYLAFVEGEPGAEVYSAATKRDQAKICHKDATRMVKSSPQLRELIGVFRDNLHEVKSGSKFEPLSSDYNTMDGLNAHAVIADELHAWKGMGMWGVLKTAMSSRRQPLFLSITTAGVDQQGICYQQRQYVERILKGLIEDDAYWGIIYTLDRKRDWPELRARGEEGDGTAEETGELETGDGEGVEFEDRWDDEAVWVKANPLLGVSKKLDMMRGLAREAKNKPAELNNFLRWELNIWTQATSRWISPIYWAKCGELAVDPEALAGRTCFAGLDLSETFDLTALALVFPPEDEDGVYQALMRFWLPEENMMERVERDQVYYDVWARMGYITLTPGNVVDHNFILAEIDKLAQRYDIVEVGFDRWGASQVMIDLMEMGGDEWVVPIGQGYASMSPPTKDVGKLIAGGKLAHGNNPVLTWMADNMVVRTDPAGNIKPDKEKAREKIDGIVALIMAMDRALRHGGTTSKYEEEDLLVL